MIFKLGVTSIIETTFPVCRFSIPISLNQSCSQKPKSVHRNMIIQATQKSDLTAHKHSVHEGKKDQCKDCSSLFTVKSNLTKHQNSVHMGKKYPCNLCSYQANQNGNLKTHNKTKHSCNVFVSK